MENKINTIKTRNGQLKYTVSFESGIKMINPKTIGKYLSIKEKGYNTDISQFAAFFAFSNVDYNKEVEDRVRRGLMKEGEKIYSYGAGLYGTKKGLNDYFRVFDEQDIIIAEECDPQEVYFYEFNDHESFLSYDGDESAIKIIVSIFGKETAQKIKRYNECYQIT